MPYDADSECSLCYCVINSGECQNISVSIDRTPAPRIRRRRLMCSCDAEFKPQPVVVDNVVTDPHSETNQVNSDNPDDS